MEIEVTPSAIPEKLYIDLSTINLGDTVTADAIIDLPEGATLVTAADRVILNCVPPKIEVEEEDTTAAGAAEPELVGKKEEEPDAGGE